MAEGNNFPIYGNILVKDGLPDIQRCLDSLIGITDKIYVVDSFSTDGTWEWLNNVKDVYKLELFQNKFETFMQQRNFLLRKTTKPCWLVTLDADEAFSTTGSLYLRGLLQKMDEKELEEKSKEWVIDIVVPYCNLKNSVRERTEYATTIANRVFFCTDDILWKNESHCFPCLNHKPNEPAYAHHDCPPEVAIKHYAFLDPAKMRVRQLRKEMEVNKSDFDNDFYYKIEHKVVPLEDHLW